MVEICTVTLGQYVKIYIVFIDIVKNLFKLLIAFVIKRILMLRLRIQDQNKEHVVPRKKTRKYSAHKDGIHSET